MNRNAECKMSSKCVIYQAMSFSYGMIGEDDCYEKGKVNRKEDFRRKSPGLDSFKKVLRLLV